VNALAGGREVIRHRVVVAANAVACATCGTVAARRPEKMRRGRWSVEAETAAQAHVMFPAASAVGASLTPRAGKTH